MLAGQRKPGKIALTCDFRWVEVLQRYSKFAKPSKLCHSTSVRSVPIAPPRVHNAQRRLGPDAIAQLIADYESGTSSNELMTTYHLGKGAVLRLLRAHSVKMRAQGMPPERLLEAIQLYQSGWPLQRLGDRYDCDAETVRKRLLEAGVAMRPQQGGRH